ncbi:hypothetical protein GMES_0440 [Paraglaciecola mesophila KMM 241]|uniref:Uncharacterized protein n=1 Tax=Paraglaciecola mesophila KMM 241 TaxID=1128912 RepID=K6YFI7_9ALTE|nr:hypothetical protein GMES_0440 [Paraglaciecola mesophila KMM 241]
MTRIATPIKSSSYMQIDYFMRAFLKSVDTTLSDPNFWL